MVPITAALLRKFDLHHLLEDNWTLGGTYHCHTTTSSLLTMGDESTAQEREGFTATHSSCWASTRKSSAAAPLRPTPTWGCGRCACAPCTRSPRACTVSWRPFASCARCLCMSSSSPTICVACEVPRIPLGALAFLP